MRHNDDVSTPDFSANLASCKGKLLVATPPLADPNFDRTVVYVLEHTFNGAVGVVLNRPTDEDAPGELYAWTDHMSPPATLFSGGPVDTAALIALARLTGAVDGSWSQVAPGLGSIDLTLDPYEVAQGVHALRVFRGYSDWRSWARAPGWCSTPSWPMSFAPPPPACGAGFCAAKAVDSLGWPTLQTTSARTEPALSTGALLPAQDCPHLGGGCFHLGAHNGHVLIGERSVECL